MVLFEQITECLIKINFIWTLCLRIFFGLFQALQVNMHLSQQQHCILYVATMMVYKTRLGVVCSVLRPSCAVAVCSFAVLGSIGNWALAVLTGSTSYEQLWDVTEEYVGCSYCVSSLLKFHCVCT